MRLLHPLRCAQFIAIICATICQAESFDIDTAASRVYSRVDTVGVGHSHGIEGKLRASSLNLMGSGQFIIDMTTFSADTPVARTEVGLKGSLSESDKKQTTINMHSAAVLDVAQFPTATFEIMSITPVKDKPAGAYILAGNFTLHGVKRPLTFSAKIEPMKGRDAGVMRMHGSFVVKQTDYGMTPYSAFGGLSKLANDVKIWGDIVLVPTKHNPG